MRVRRIIVLAAALSALSLGAAACGSDDNGATQSAATSEPAATSAPAATTSQGGAAIQRNAANAATTLTVGSKNFTEQKILGEIYAQAFQAAGYTVKKALNLGDQDIALAALKDDQISGYPEYTGTALLSFLKVAAADLPSDEGEAYEQVKTGMTDQGITAFPPTPFTSSNEVGMLKSRADELGVTKISDLADKAGDLTLYGSPECRTRRDCLLGLEEVYGLKFKRFVPVNLDQRHEVLTSGQADISIVFTTDPQIKRNNEVLLEDDKGMFPPYNSTFLMKTETVDAAGPDLPKTIEAVNKNLTAEVMQELNARVDLDKDTPEQAAQAYLKQFNLIPA